MAHRTLRSAVSCGAAVACAAGCAPAVTSGVSAAGVVSIVAAENQYGSVASQIGGRYAHVSAVETNPGTDPHAYEVSARVAREVAGAAVIIQNGAGYDPFMVKVVSASPNPRRKVLDVQHLVGAPSKAADPHLWYDPATMPRVAQALCDYLSAIEPAHAGYFRSNLSAFDASLRPWQDAIAAFRARHPGTRAATTEPVADHLLEAMGIVNLTPASFQAAVMNGTDPTPQAVAYQDHLLSSHAAQLFVYNAQVVDPVTESLRRSAAKAGVPVVAVYETMPGHGYDYQTWMLAETRAITAAAEAGVSTGRL